MMNSFRFKLGILLAVIASAFIVSQVVYRNTITAMHDSVFSAVETLEVVHEAENFHSAIHMMLYLATIHAQRKASTTVVEYDKKRAIARSAIDGLFKSAEPSANLHHDAKSPESPQTGDLRALFHAFATETDAVFSGTDGKTSAHLEKARTLFDNIFRNHITALHNYHTTRLASLKTSAHEMNQRVTFFFYGQLAIILLSAAVALVFSNRVLLNLYTTTERRAFSDSLTGLKNRRYLDDVVVKEARDLIRKNAPFSVIFADIDRFKSFNDAYGHPAGDKLLTEFADHLRKGIRRADTVVRYGGEEFVVLLPGAGKEAAAAIAEKMRGQIEAAAVFLPSGEPGKKVTASFGIAAFPDDGVGKFKDLLKKADERLYLAKSSGRNRVVC
ncbi:MAG: GGDEF domain-containing protein [Syntrophales bacterium]|nr:GGDEF domain-containing protein [Syntrophales bacterium]